MTTVSKNAAPVKTHRSKAKAEATRRGLLYALPDWLMIIMLFFGANFGMMAISQSCCSSSWPVPAGR